MSLREAFVNIARNCATSDFGKDKPGYFQTFEENVFGGDIYNQDRNAFESADGNEFKLNGKARAAYSSSMFAYNFFSWIGKNFPCTIDGDQYDERFFEVRVPCLTVSRANIDVTLLSKDKKKVLFIESKLTEHLSNALSKMRGLSDAYTNADKYYCNCEKWSKTVKKWRKKAVDASTGYFDGIKQEICHRIAIDNLRSGEAKVLSGFENLNVAAGRDQLIETIRNPAAIFSFASLVFEPNRNFIREYRKFDDYKALHQEFAKSINDANDCSFKTYTELWTNKDFMANMPSELREYLDKRYMQFSA